MVFEQRPEYSEKKKRRDHLGGEHQAERLGRAETQDGQPAGAA